MNHFPYKMKNKALFILNSPFQAMCAVEAILHYKVQNPSFFIFDCEDSVKKTKSVISSCGGDVSIIPHAGTVALIKFLKGNTARDYNTFFVGDYYSYDQYLIAILLSKIKSRIVYLDDGTSTLDMLPPFCRKRSKGITSRRLAYLVLDIMSKLKRIRSTFFSIFDLSSFKQFPYETNTLSTWKKFDINHQTVGDSIFIIGTNSSVLSFKGCSYIDILQKTIEYIRTRFPKANIYYCPHRRDKNDYSDYLDERGLHTFSTKVSVEVDFLKQRITPRLIIGFASTALLSLKSIYPTVDVCSVHIEDINAETNKSIRSIESYYKNNNIEILYL